PTVLVLEDRLRVYFASRPRPDLSLTTFVDLDIGDPGEILSVHERPVLEPGPPGAFDEHGVMPCCAFEHEGRVWLYYSGWSRRASIPYSNWSGLAVSEDGGQTFRKAFPGPIVDRTPEEIFSATAVWVVRQPECWHMWYASGTEWVEIGGKSEEVYRIRHGVSPDGIHWKRENRELLSFRRRHEPTHRPSVIRIGDSWHMWFSHRGVEDFRNGSDAYRLGYARSDDLECWTRDDSKAGLDVSDRGWDSRMTAYPCVVRAQDRVLMFYNGDGFGQTGFGYAVLRED
ncbi:MAG: hypothetical protein ACLFV8_10370, partial [Alphaproteobacteria bacterium]